MKVAILTTKNQWFETYQSLKKIKLEVFSNNIKAIDLYKKFNSRKISMENMHNKTLVCMELEK